MWHINPITSHPEMSCCESLLLQNKTVTRLTAGWREILHAAVRLQFACSKWKWEELCLAISLTYQKQSIKYGMCNALIDET